MSNPNRFKTPSVLEQLNRMNLAAESTEAQGFQGTAQAMRKIMNCKTQVVELTAQAILEDPLFKHAADMQYQLELLCSVLGSLSEMPEHFRIVLADARLVLAQSKGEIE